MKETTSKKKSHSYSRINRKRSSHERTLNKDSEENKDDGISFVKKYFKDKEENRQGSSINTIAGNYICLDQGEVIIKGRDIETVVPCEIENVFFENGRGNSMILPNQPVKITITPIDEGESVESDKNNPSTTKPNPDLNKNSSDNSSKLHPAYLQLMGIIEKHFCLREVKATCGQSEERPMSSFNSIEKQRNGEQNDSLRSSSSNRAFQDQNRPENESNSQPIFHNANNDNWFSNGGSKSKNP
ncbi:unnamed protein product [Moneuplotes crassus]|uniref:Uncharacterized protein n=2 Tax=Euplotes crassus TaxID=5936 RepID=A0AAD1UA45_EUPCR|nr:unnamed protein product [Moneuplotes crassus]